MAREPVVPDNGEFGGSRGSDADGRDTNTPLDRRSYLKLAGATAVAATTASAATGAVGASGGDYDVVRARGQTIEIGRGETFENKLIDLTTGDSVLLLVTGADSTIRNVGFEGIHRGDQFMISIDAGRGDVLVENVYLGDGSTKEGEDFVHGPGAVFMHRNNDADVTFRYCNVQGWPNNAFYCSNTPYGGSVRFEYCFGKNNGVSTFRCASGDDAIVGCVAYNDTTDYGRGYGGYGETNGRPVWVWNGGTVTIRDSHFADGPYPYALVAGANGSPGRVDFESGAISGAVRRGSGSTVSVGGAVSSEPDLSIPEGVPTSAEEAAAGGEPRSRGDHAALEYTYEFVAEGESEPTDYYFEIEAGPIEPSSYNGAAIEPEYTWVSDDGTRAAGRVVDGRHAWEFDSLLVDVTVDGPAEPFVDGDPSSLSRYPRAGATGDEWKGDMPWHETGRDLADEEPTDGGVTDDESTDGDVTDDESTDGDVTDDESPEADLEHTLLIDGVGILGKTSYEFRVSGDVEPSDYLGATINDDTAIEDGHVSGSLRGWRDAFEFSGELESLAIEGTARVYLDGERVDPSDYGEDLDHILTIVGNGSSARYEVRVDGRIEAFVRDDSSEAAAIRDGRTVVGSIDRGYQRFRYAGSITDLTFAEGSAMVYADRERLDLGDA